MAIARVLRQVFLGLLFIFPSKNDKPESQLTMIARFSNVEELAFLEVAFDSEIMIVDDIVVRFRTDFFYL